MTWAKFDDLYDDTKKIKRAWRALPAIVGLHAMAVTYCARHETDGVSEQDWIEEKLALARDRARKIIKTACDLGLFDVLEAGETREMCDQRGYSVTVGPFLEDVYVVHDYLDYNDSSAYLNDKRATDRARKTAGGRKQRPATPDSARNPNGIHAESKRSPEGFQAASGSPDPTRPDPSPPNPPDGGAANGAASRRRKPQHPDPDAYPDDLPAGLRPAADHVVKVLGRVATAKGAKQVTHAAAGRVVADYPRHDHGQLAGEFEHWWVHGPGATRQMRDVALTYRNRLGTLPAAITPLRQPAPAGGDPVDFVQRLNAGQARLQAQTPPTPENAA